MLKAADEYRCDLIATGHYARIAEHRGHWYLRTAVDTHKDQTYFLWMLTEENLKRTIFPLGELTKPEVRQIAFDHGFEKLSKKAESQEICFVPNNDYRTFLAEQGVHIEKGKYLSADGQVVGEHEGFCNYTIGQRKGLGIALGTPQFVQKINAETNEVTLGTHDALYSTHVEATNTRIRDIDWLRESPDVEARIRYKSPTTPARISIGDKGRIALDFEQSVWGVTPGQSLVIYKDGLVVAGGLISN